MGGGNCWYLAGRPRDGKHPATPGTAPPRKNHSNHLPSSSLPPLCHTGIVRDDSKQSRAAGSRLPFNCIQFTDFLRALCAK